MFRDWRFWVEVAKIVVAVGTATFAIFTWRSHLAEQRDQQAFEFRLQAAQVVMNEGTCKAGIEKAHELRILFPDQLAAFGTDPFAAFACDVIEHPEKFRFAFTPRGNIFGTTTSPFRLTTTSR